MRLIDADELMEHVGRDRLDSRELIAKMIENAPTVETNEKLYKKKIADMEYRHDSDMEQMNQWIGRLEQYDRIFDKMLNALILRNEGER